MISEDESNPRPRFNAQLKKNFDVHIPTDIVQELELTPGKYLTFEIVPVQEGHDKPYTTSHEIEAKQRIAEADEIGQSTFNFLLAKWMANFREHLLLTTGTKVKNVEDIAKPEQRTKSIIVGAGPSLYSTTEEQWNALKTFDGIIISTNKALTPLLKNGIVPHWVVALDGDPAVFGSFNDPVVDAHKGEVMFLGATVLDPKVTKFALSWAKECYWGNPHMPSAEDSDKWNLNVVLEMMNGVTLLRHGGNVGTCAWLLAKHLGCDPVAMMGFDLCMYPDNTWKRSDMIDYEIFYNPERGEVIALNAAFRAYAAIIIGASDQAWNEEPPTRTVNVTPRGALHMTSFFPNFTVEEFACMSNNDIVARADKERELAVERMAKKIENAKEAMKPIFRDEI